MDIVVIIEQVLILAVLMAVGFVGGKTKVLGEIESDAMTKVLTQIALPALTISAFSVGFSKETINGVIIVLILAFLSHLFAAVIGRFAFIKYNRDQNVVLRFGNTFSNSGFMGLPFIYALMGETALLYASIYMIAFHVLLWTYGENLLKIDKVKFNVTVFIKNPAIIALIIGSIIFFINRPLPVVMATPISMLSSLTSPLAMLILGEKISQIKFKEVFSNLSLYYFTFIKLLVTPLLIAIILSFFPIDPLIKNVVIIMQALPVAVLSVVLSQKHNVDYKLASKITIITHVLSILTLPIISLILN
ncbi:MAG TPA: AEC family transporter [Erysipelotrichaceae bacterium]|nr:AEC family transporter [Erysipelotrichaceae bacterium]